MKIKPEDKEYLKKGIQGLIDQYGLVYIKNYKEGLKQDTRIKNLDVRFAWDLFHATKIKIGDGVGQPGDLNLYSYLDDSHITTALKSIVKELNL